MADDSIKSFPPLVLDVFGQVPGLSNLYTQLAFIFSLDTQIQHDQIIGNLSRGLQYLSIAFPWLAGEVVKDSSTGVYSIVPRYPNPELVVADLQGNPNMDIDALRTARFPFSLLHESAICPRTTLHLSTSSPESSPVLVLQATFVKGGMLLTFVAQHNVMDMTSQAHFIRIFDKVCRGKDIDDGDIKGGSVDRTCAIPLLDEQVPGPIPFNPSPEAFTPTCTWEYFSFSGESLSSLKKLAQSTLPATRGFVSTDDVLTAFVWQRITHARLSRLSRTTSVSTIGRAIDPRRFIGLSETYPGVVQNMSYHSFSASELVDLPLGVVASDLRGGLTKTVSPFSSELDISHSTKAFATRIAFAQDKSTVPSVTSSLDLAGYDLMLSSWANQGSLHDLTFGLPQGTRLEAIRRPSFTPVESLLYFMPRETDGEVLVGACLRVEDMERLRGDSVFTKFGEWIG
ncbi:Trichothecene 3-O-acetyltransferase [Psilocybe cubensis]|uniref:Trichothecene 3-O-acetyltransferase n=2 Tax=Psilocybe cubensis TaxID=181762 RepID=A0ACB8GJB4_PSICU|nr:Trichothecene 3-O-acetyltransferase [Psilocybe cubensis]KAH9475589.1 Trichothecene 3-O-acetyltransferase [Psilocybe cubensis]